MTKHIHIVGISPRTGTSLLLELMTNGFELTGSSQHEMSVFCEPPKDCEIYCSKKPSDLEVAAPLLRVNPQLWFICMIRDPRDIIVSRHKKAPDKSWSNLLLWRTRIPLVRELIGHPNFVVVRYEDLVQDPQQVQKTLLQRMPFLKFRASFADFHETAQPPDDTLDALGSLRPIDARSIGAWRQNKPRIAAQIEIHGSIDDDLLEFSYEGDSSWHSELEGVTPDNGESFWPEHQGMSWDLLQRLEWRRQIWKYRRRMAAVKADSPSRGWGKL